MSEKQTRPSKPIKKRTLKPKRSGDVRKKPQNAYEQVIDFLIIYLSSAQSLGLLEIGTDGETVAILPGKRLTDAILECGLEEE